MKERRRYPRQTARLVVGIETDERKDRAGLTQDVSPVGMSFRSPSRFDLGETIKLRFRDPHKDDRSVEVYGTVVRTRTEPEHYLFQHVAAVRFAGHVGALEHLARAKP